LEGKLKLLVQVLFSTLSFMLQAVLGIVLIVTGFGSGLSLIPPLNGIPSAAYNNENSAANDSAANETQKYGDSEYINEGIDATDHEWVDINATRSRRGPFFKSYSFANMHHAIK